MNWRTWVNHVRCEPVRVLHVAGGCVSVSAARPVTVREKEAGKECHLTESSHS